MVFECNKQLEATPYFIDQGKVPLCVGERSIIKSWIWECFIKNMMAKTRWKLALQSRLNNKCLFTNSVSSLLDAILNRKQKECHWAEQKYMCNWSLVVTHESWSDGFLWNLCHCHCWKHGLLSHLWPWQAATWGRSLYSRGHLLLCLPTLHPSLSACWGCSFP